MMFHKSKGNAGDILGTGFCLTLILIVLWAGIQYMQLLMIKRDVENVGREFVLLLEQNGELTDENKEKLDTRISGIFPSSQSITYTYNEDNTKRGYGEEVSLYLKIVVSSSDLRLRSVNAIFKNSYTFETKQYSTAKHNK